VQSGLHSYLALGNEFRSTFVLDTQLCSQVYTRIWHSAVQSTAVDQTASDPSNGVCPALADSGAHCPVLDGIRIVLPRAV
jgi:hypothetical protein